MEGTVGQGHDEALVAVVGQADDFGVLSHRRPGVLAA
jgi:hypothetical protein